MHMTGRTFSRRQMLQSAAAMAAAALAPRTLFAQQAARTPAASLPARGEFVIRGATVLTMDAAVPDLVAGDVHVRDGTIVAVAQKIQASAAQLIDGAGMICIPGFVDTHFHMWNALFRPFVLADVPALGYFPVTARLGPLMRPEDSYRSVRLAATDAIAAGITTVHNWSHNTRSRSMQKPSSPPCATWASADGSPTARPWAWPTTRRWTSPASRASRRAGCRTRTAC